MLDSATLIEIDRSDATFTIQAPWGNIIRPFADPDPYRGGTTTQLEWIAGGSTCVRFEYSVDNGATWTAITGTFNAAIGKAN